MKDENRKYLEKLKNYKANDIEFQFFEYKRIWSSGLILDIEIALHSY